MRYPKSGRRRASLARACPRNRDAELSQRLKTANGREYTRILFLLAFIRVHSRFKSVLLRVASLPPVFVRGSGHRKVGAKSDSSGASLPAEAGTPNPKPPAARSGFGVPPSGGRSRRFSQTRCSRSFSWPGPLSAATWL